MPLPGAAEAALAHRAGVRRLLLLDVGLAQARVTSRWSGAEALTLAGRIAKGPTFAHMMTKTQLNQEWSMSLEQAIESEAQAQAICMQTEDFSRAYHAFVAKGKPVFEGN